MSRILARKAVQTKEAVKIFSCQLKPRKFATSPSPISNGPVMVGGNHREYFGRIPPEDIQLLYQSAPPFAVNIAPSVNISLNSMEPQIELKSALENLNNLFSKCEAAEWPLGVTTLNDYAISSANNTSSN